MEGQASLSYSTLFVLYDCVVLLDLLKILTGVFKSFPKLSVFRHSSFVSCLFILDSLKCFRLRGRLPSSEVCGLSRGKGAQGHENSRVLITHVPWPPSAVWPGAAPSPRPPPPHTHAHLAAHTGAG